MEVHNSACLRRRETGVVNQIGLSERLNLVDTKQLSELRGQSDGSIARRPQNRCLIPTTKITIQGSCSPPPSVKNIYEASTKKDISPLMEETCRAGRNCNHRFVQKQMPVWSFTLHSKLFGRLTRYSCRGSPCDTSSLEIKVCARYHFGGWLWHERGKTCVDRLARSAPVRPFH